MHLKRQTDHLQGKIHVQVSFFLFSMLYLLMQTNKKNKIKSHSVLKKSGISVLLMTSLRDPSP